MEGFFAFENMPSLLELILKSKKDQARSDWLCLRSPPLSPPTAGRQSRPLHERLVLFAVKMSCQACLSLFSKAKKTKRAAIGFVCEAPS
jgi:hypothetical protein